MDTTGEPCGEWHALIVDMLDGSASPEDVAAVQDHIRHCPVCAADLAFAQRMQSTWPVPSREAAPADLFDRIADTTWNRPRSRWWGLWSARPAWLAVPAAVAIGIVSMQYRATEPVRVVSSESSQDRVAVMPAEPRPTVPIPATTGKVPSPAAPATTSVPRALARRVDSAGKGTQHPVRTRRMVALDSVREESVSAIAAGRAAVQAMAPVLRTDAAQALVTSAGIVAASLPRTTTFETQSTESVQTVSAPSVPMGLPASQPSSQALASHMEDDIDRSSYQSGLTAQSEASRQGKLAVRATQSDASRVSVVQAPVSTGNR